MSRLAPFGILRVDFHTAYGIYRRHASYVIPSAAKKNLNLRECGEMFNRTFFYRALIICAAFHGEAWAKVVHYDLNIENRPFQVTGRNVDFAILVNGGIPGPVLEFTEGDEAEIVVKNSMPKGEVSIHWHGILLPPMEDGVPYVNTPPILPGQSRTFRFPIRQHGTYWYHSHTGVQEQKGVYGAIVIHPKKPTVKATKEATVVMSDWSDENAEQILKNLRKDGDYYLYKKDSVRSIGGALKAGEFKSYLANQWNRMGGMDLSDVGYDAFLINGRRDSQLLTAKAGDVVRLRIINGSASSYFYVSLGQIDFQVIAADGVDVEPKRAKELLMGMAETYDILFKIPATKNFELRATAQDVTGFASAWIGSGEKVSAATKEKPDLYAPMMMHGMDHGMTMAMDHHMGHDMNHDMNHDMSAITTMTVDDLKATRSTRFPESAKVMELKLVLGGDMERYVWHINGKAVYQDRNIDVREGDVVRFVFENETMMHHPMHLHGHFFRVLNKFGDFSPLKHTVDVPPHGTRTIEFMANEPGQWMLHCHNLYHMKNGMARVVRYMSFKPTPEMAEYDKKDPHRHDHVYSFGRVEAATNRAQAKFKLIRTWDEVDGKWEWRNDQGRWENEGDLFYRRWFGRFFSLLVGGTYFSEKGAGLVGFGYTLPLRVESRAFVNHQGHFRLDLEKKFQWTKSLFSDAEFSWRPDWGGGHDGEWTVTFMYGPSWSWAAGLILTNDNLGAGAQFQF